MKWGVALMLVFLVATAWVFLDRARLGRERERQGKPRLVCFGDSLTAGGGNGGRYSDYLAAALPEFQVINRGVSGDTLESGRRRLQREVLALQPDLVILELGANDYWRQTRPISALRADLEYMVQAIQRSGAEVVLVGVFGDQEDEAGHVRPKQFAPGKHEFGRRILEMEREVAEKYGLVHVENLQARLFSEATHPQFWLDERHPSPEGNRRVAELLAKAVRETLEHSREEAASDHRPNPR
jgi:acyl-CoA thioesterase-1